MQQIIDEHDLVDHRAVISALDLGHIPEHSPGMIVWHPHGVRVVEKLKKLIQEMHERKGYQQVSSPILMHKSLWQQSGHWDKYREHMFVAGEGESAMAVKPMSCPGQIEIYKHRPKSYRDLPVRYFEFGHVHRNEASGALSGWLRLRGFVQDDSHVFARRDQIQSVVGDFISMVEEIYPMFGFAKWSWSISLRPEKRAGSDAVWDEAEQALRDACAGAGIAAEEKPGEGAFYGPKLEVALEDRLGRKWQCGVIQADFVLPERFDLLYHDHDSQQKQPVILHHAVLGSLERWLSIVMEHHGLLPDWLHPRPVAVFPVAKRHEEHANAVAQRLREMGVMAFVSADGPLNGRIKDADLGMVPWRVVVGDREMQSGVLAARKYREELKQVSAEDLAKIVLQP